MIFITFFSLIILAGLLRFYSIGSKDLWLDEANTVAIASSDTEALAGKLKLDSSPPLYYLLLHFWMKIFGGSEAGVRSLSALFGVGLVAGIFLAARRLFGLETAAIAGLFAAVSPVLVMYSQETRMYSLLPILSLLSFFFFVEYLADPRPVRLILSAVFTLLALYTHNFGFFLLPLQLAMLIMNRSPLRTCLTWLVSLIALVVLYLPWLPVLHFQLLNGVNYAWIGEIWRAFGLFGTLFQTLISFSAQGDHAKYLTPGITWIGGLSLAAMASAAAAGIFYMIRNGKMPKTGVKFFHVLAYVFLPLSLSALASVVSRPIYVAGRTDQLVFPGFCLALAFLLAAIRFRPLRYFLFAAMVLLSLYSLKDYYRYNYKAGDRRIARAILRESTAADAVVFTGLSRASVEYYLRREQPGLRCFSFPEEMASHMGNYRAEELLKDPARLKSDAESIASEIAHSGIKKVFLVFVPDQVDDFLSSGLEQRLDIKDAILIGEFRQSLLKTRIELYRIDL